MTTDACIVKSTDWQLMIDPLSKTKTYHEPATFSPIQPASKLFTKRKRDTKEDAKIVAGVSSKKKK